MATKKQTGKTAAEKLIQAKLKLLDKFVATKSHEDFMRFINAVNPES